MSHLCSIALCYVEGVRDNTKVVSIACRQWVVLCQEKFPQVIAGSCRLWEQHQDR